MSRSGGDDCGSDDRRFDDKNKGGSESLRLIMNDELSKDGVIADLRAQNEAIVLALEGARAQIASSNACASIDVGSTNDEFRRVLCERESVINELRSQNGILNQLVDQLRGEIRVLTEKISSMDSSLLSIAANLSGTTTPPRMLAKRPRKSAVTSTPNETAAATITDIDDDCSEVLMRSADDYDYSFPPIEANAKISRPFVFGTPIPRIDKLTANAVKLPAGAVDKPVSSTAGSVMSVLTGAVPRTTNVGAIKFGTNGWSTVTSKSKDKSTAPAGSRKVTPIQLQKMSASELIGLGSELADRVDKDEMFIQQMGDNRMPRIVCRSSNTKTIIVDYLKERQLQFNSYNNSDTRQKAFIVRGLICDDTDEAIRLIRSAVLDMGVTVDVGVKRFETSYQRHHPSANRIPLYQLTVPAAVEDRMLLDMYTIGYSRVRVEKMNKSSTIQCHRCQRLHHTTGQCNFAYRCVQCTSPHTYGNCPRANNRNLPIGCVNCHDAKLNSKDHTANDLKNCNYFKKTCEQQQQQKFKQQQTISTGTNGLQAKNVSAKPITANKPASISGRLDYASAVKGGAGGLTAAQISELVTVTVNSVIAALFNGA